MTLHIIISGIVQKVGYRKFAKKKADELGITGSVKNLKDFNVEIFANGDAEFLEAFISLLKIGPERARVDQVHTQAIPQKQFHDFTILKD
ncbi:acylphosphatase [Helicobacter anatolicus]|uniref:acylphosphatase n=1 Tax=Helicobacter anatolicus TaxID=2905874 RepID=UPI001E385727|nr:acylphosphatase [Helicobacter anatolicus]MCE3037873.1 acylphosphatase [Helicobacter anatolicus]